jgi:hypothetical protein
VPELIDHPQIAELQSVKRLPDPDRRRMRDEEKRNRQTERELPALAGRHAQMSPAIERKQTEGAMGEE